MKRLPVEAWLLLLPSIVLLGMFAHIPIVLTLWDSFFSVAHGTRPPHFIGLDNYQDVLADRVFWQALRNNVLYALGTIPVSIALALLMAVLVNGGVLGRGLLRMAYFTPTILPMIATANIWLFFYAPDIGLIGQVLGLFGWHAINWLGQETTALPAIMAVTIWQESGFFMIFYLAALQQIPPDLKDAADVAGASRWDYFSRITWPLLGPTTLFVAVNATINAFRAVDHVFVMTKGGPNNATNLLLYHLYEVGFKFWDVPQALVITVIMLVVMASLALGQFLMTDKTVHYQ